MEAIEYEDRYFSDLAITAKRIRQRLLGSKMEIDGQWIKTESDIHVSIADDWIFRYRRFKNDNWLGLCRNRRREIFIKPGLSADEHKGVVLHELIHAYEWMLPRAFQDWLMVDLLRRLNKTIGPKVVRRWIDINTHIDVHELSHNGMFLLKSLELDHRLGWKLGTVFGYGRNEFL